MEIRLSTPCNHKMTAKTSPGFTAYPTTAAKEECCWVGEAAQVAAREAAATIAYCEVLTTWHNADLSLES